MEEAEKEMVEKWKLAMERGKDYLIEKHLDLVEEQLVNVSERLYNVTESFEALFGVATMEKKVLIQHGQAFAYQQAILDVVSELEGYASGVRDLQEDKEDARKILLKEMGAAKNEHDTEGIYQ